MISATIYWWVRVEEKDMGNRGLFQYISQEELVQGSAGEMKKNGLIWGKFMMWIVDFVVSGLWEGGDERSTWLPLRQVEQMDHGFDMGKGRDWLRDQNFFLQHIHLAIHMVLLSLDVKKAVGYTGLMLTEKIYSGDVNWPPDGFCGI